jgi:hypothetical protein
VKPLSNLYDSGRERFERHHPQYLRNLFSWALEKLQSDYSGGGNWRKKEE